MLFSVGNMQNVLTRKNNDYIDGFLVDMHIHTNFSIDCYVPIDDTLQELMGKVNAITITDHNEMGNHTKTLVDSLELKYQIKILTKSVEISTLHGDILAYGITAAPSTNLEPEQVIDIIHSEGGIAVAAHPFDFLGLGDLIYELDLDALEINGLRSQIQNNQTKEAAESLGLPLIGGSDSHRLNQTGKCVTQFEKPVTSIDDVIKQVKKGQCKHLFLR
jgi:predicted metal-dependent phosphoesterase TrpH